MTEQIGVSRADAIARGISLYYGKCKHHGPESIRRVSSFICVECGKIRDRKWRSENKESVRENRKKWDRKNPIKIMLIYARKRAKKNNLPFNITENDIKIPENCPILGIKLSRSEGESPKDNSPSLDRIICANGYVPNNIIVISYRANKIKNNSTIEELKKITEFYENLEKLKNDQW